MVDPDLTQLIGTRRTPTSLPMLPPWDHLVVVTDTNALASRACNTARTGRAEDLFCGLARTGRSNTYISSHIPGELALRFKDVAKSTGVDLETAVRILLTQVLPGATVTDLAIRDYLHPRLKPILNADRSLPKSLRGDQDDVGTAALAEFLAPAVILSADSVFTRLGLSNTTAVTWVQTAYSMLRAAGFEASYADAAMLVELAARMMFIAGRGIFQAVRRYPIPALAILAGTFYLAKRLGYIEGDRVRNGLRRVGAMAGPMLEAFTEAVEGHADARSGLFIVEPYGTPTLEQQAARYLARCGRALTPGELRDQLRGLGCRTSATELKRTMASHPAFVRSVGDVYCIGRPALTSFRPTSQQQLPG